MSQSQAPSTGRAALAIGVIALIIGASALGYAVYLGLSQVPAQLSALSVDVNPSDKTIRIEWTTAFESGQDRFYPNYITVAQGDNVTILLITNDTIDGHTFTLPLGIRGLPSSALFQLNNSWAGLTSGPYIGYPDKVHPSPSGIDCCLPNGGNYNAQTNFTGPPTGCFDQNGNSYTCNTQNVNGTSYSCDAYSGKSCALWSSGWLGPVTVPGVYRFYCFYHQKAGMIGYLTVLPNKAYTG